MKSETRYRFAGYVDHEITILINSLDAEFLEAGQLRFQALLTAYEAFLWGFMFGFISILQSTTNTISTLFSIIYIYI